MPTTLSPDGRSRRPHLRSFHVGWRLPRFLLLYSPRWLFSYPGLLLFLFGISASAALAIGPIEVGDVGFDIGTPLLAVSMTIVGYLGLWFARMSRDFAAREGLLPDSHRINWFERYWSLERGIAVGAMLFVTGAALAAISFLRWRSAGFGALDGRETVRSVAPVILGFVLGIQTIFASLFWSMLRLHVRR